MFKKFARFFVLLFGVLCAGFVFAACDKDDKVTIKSISLTTTENEIVINQNDNLDLSNFTVEVKYSDGSTKYVDSSELDFSEIDTSIVGNQTLTITYNGKKVEINIKVQKYVTSVAIKSGSVATTVQHNSQLDTSNLVFVETYSDGSTREITEGLEILDIDTTSCGNHTLYVTYDGRTAELVINVQKYITAVSIKSSSVPTAVKQNGVLNTSGLIFVQAYSDGSEDEITQGVQIGAFDTSVLGAQELSATYNGRTAKISITVYDYVTSISVKGTLQAEYLQYHNYNFDELVIVAHHSNGDETEFRYADRETATNGIVTAFQDNEVVAFVDASVTGNHNLKFTLSLDSETYTTTDSPITIHALKTITIDPTTVQTTLYQNSDSYENGLYNLDDVVAVLTYDNDTTERVKFVEIDGTTAKYNIYPYIDEDTCSYSINTYLSGANHYTIKYNYNNLPVSAEEECTLDINVVAMTGIEIDETNTPNYVLRYQSYDESKIKAIAHYQDNHSEETTYYVVQFDNGDLIIKTPDYSFEDSLTLETIEIDHIVVKDSNNNSIQGYQCTIPDCVGETYTITVTYANNDVVIYTKELKETNSDIYFNFLTSSYGDMVPGCSIPNNGEFKITIYSNSLEGYATYSNTALSDVQFLYDGVERTQFIQGEDLDLDKITLKAIWEDDRELLFEHDTQQSETPDYINGNNHIFINSEIDTDTLGAHNITLAISFNGAYLEKPYSYEVIKDEYGISGYKYQSSLAVRNAQTQKVNTYTYEGSTGVKGFQTIDNTYLVGSGNSFKYAPVMTVQYDDETLGNEGSEELTDFLKDVTLYIYNENQEEFVKVNDSDVKNYVTISGNDYQFTTLAENKTFKLKVVPASMSEADRQMVEASGCTTFTFKVVSGWNVYTAADLSVIDNTNATIENAYSEYVNHNIAVDKSDYTDSGKWTTFKQNHNIDLNNNATTIILHSNINITVDDIPSIHTYVHEDDGTTRSNNVYMVDSLEQGFNYIYQHTMKPGETFTIEGNHYSISTNSLPIMVRQHDKSKDNAVDTPIVAHTTLLKIQGDENNAANAESQNFVMRNLELEGNSAASENEQNWGGIISIKMDTVNSLVENVYSHEWYISLMWEGYEQEANNQTQIVKDTNCFNANNCLLYIWATRDISFENCNMIKCGGPVMIVDHKEGEGEGECPSNVHVKDCVLQSYVTGEESWFKSFGDGAATLVATIKSLNGLYSNYVLSGSQKSFLDGSGKMNLIALYKSGDAEGLPSSYEQLSGTFVDDTMVKDGSGNDTETRVHGAVENGNPITSNLPYGFNTATGGMDLSTTNSSFPYLTTTNGALGIPSGDSENPWAIAPDVDTLNAAQDYLFLYHQLGIVIILGWM